MVLKVICFFFLPFLIIQLLFMKGGVTTMIALYATLIINGKKTVNDVPVTLREQVKQMLIDADLADLAE